MNTTPIPTVDMSTFSCELHKSTTPTAAHLKAARDLVATLHRFGFVNITGHGLSNQEITDMFAWSKKMFDLPFQEKMIAPHPDGPIPHRGYSMVGREKVYARDDIKGDSVGVQEGGKELKESYEIGSEQDDQQTNIWLPEDVLPGFRPYMSNLYERLANLGEAVLNAIAVGLSMSSEEHDALMQMCSRQNCHLRLLHYPAIPKESLQNEGVSRLTPHTDWSSFTILFQHQSDELELLDPKTKQYLRASPPEGALTLNVSDMLQRFTNGYFISALHRVPVPSANDVTDTGVPARYSVPFFVAPHPSQLVQTLPRFVSAEKPARYEPIRFQDYDALAAKYTYREGQEE
ncbi:Clavaminate synthase-like protein [Podospora aff. communis PSN243]|uniref:Clavaminate synthase-like protein n=1 Tax=Podospora aff. communis PSN243 TaxID=3040156 RepID=A0AAV9GHL2_9PEZI|nr:Clavaminate synthase-like protein [Podospora aff. communis PSN243]